MKGTYWGRLWRKSSYQLKGWFALKKNPTIREKTLNMYMLSRIKNVETQQPKISYAQVARGTNIQVMQNIDNPKQNYTIMVPQQ